MTSKDIWIPDIVPFMMPDAIKGNNLPFGEDVRPVIKNDGSVIYIQPVTIKTWCPVNYDKWPFGEQVREMSHSVCFLKSLK